jgi:D-glycero-alpha-D-manno-heptose-7-phosphate kinase
VPDVIVARAPTRIDFGGGWTDVPPYSDEVGGFVCNVAITRYATVTVARQGAGLHPASTRAGDRSIAEAAARRLGVRDVTVSIESDFPIGAGLGGSSAAGVAAVAALSALSTLSAAGGDELDPGALAELSRDIETTDLGIAGGRQDHYAAAYGGALGLRFARNRIDVQPIPLPSSVRAELERRALVIYTGQSRISGATIDAVIGAYRSGELRVLDALHRMRTTAEDMAAALARGDLDALAELVAEQWTHQRGLHPAIPTPLIDDIVARAYAAGAAGVKALGASGGGCVLALARRGREDEVRAAIAPLGELMAFSVAERGVERGELVTQCE